MYNNRQLCYKSYVSLNNVLKFDIFDVKAYVKYKPIQGLYDRKKT